MQITAYKCDVCGKIIEEPLCYTLKSHTSEFSIQSGSPMSYHKGACSNACAQLGLANWIMAHGSNLNPILAEDTLRDEAAVLDGRAMIRDYNEAKGRI